MSGSMRSKAWMVAASIATIKALKYKGICRWNHTMIRSLNQHAKNNLKSCSQQQRKRASLMRDEISSENGLERSEGSLNTVIVIRTGPLVLYCSMNDIAILYLLHSSRPICDGTKG
ncbi:hypothetical protein AKJ16_DCAP22979 [Drosera capensis]